jgi:hypothetical protein
MEQKTIANTPPDFTGLSRAWRVKYTPPKGTENRDGTVALWIINAPWAHPIWSNYMLLCVHLRPLSEGAAAIIHKPGATHEVILWALDPDAPVPVETGEGMTMKPQLLQPSNFAGQFIVERDEAARAMIEEQVVKPICEGTLNPDTDATWQWINLFGDDCFKEKYRNAKPGSIEHHIKGGGTVIVAGDTTMLLNPPPEPPTKH